MLILSRKRNESIIIDNSREIKILSLHKSGRILGIKASSSMPRMINKLLQEVQAFFILKNSHKSFAKKYETL